MIYYHHHSDIWPLYHKVTFDGILKQITVNSGVSEIDVKNDLYSSWKEWCLLRDHTKFYPAFRSTGGDPTDVVNGIYSGDIYFVMNGWRIVIPHAVSVTGVLYVEEGGNPYIVLPGGGVRSTVSNLTQTVASTSGVSYTPQEIRMEMDTNSTKLSQIASGIVSLPMSIRAELSAELAQVMALQNGLTNNQAIMLTEIFNLYGLDPTKPLIVNSVSRTAGDISQSINTTAESTTITRVA